MVSSFVSPQENDDGVASAATPLSSTTMRMTPPSDIGSTAQTTISNRKRFAAITPPPDILKYIKKIGVGQPPRRRKTDRRPRPKSKGSGEVKYKKKKAKGQFINLLEPSVYEEDISPRVQLEVAPPPPPRPFSPSTRLPVQVVHEVSVQEPELPQPDPNFPELALAGRSNVGKSTLINALLYGNILTEKDEEGTETMLSKSKMSTGNKRNKTPEGAKLPKGKKAIASAKPGETKTLSFYRLGSKDTKTGLTLVDMPGYGFALHSKDLDENSFAKLASDYLCAKRGSILKRLLILVDSRHGLKPADLDFLSALEKTVLENKKELRMPPIQLVLTKADLVKQEDLARRVLLSKQHLRDVLKREYGDLRVMLVSARPGRGFNNVGWTRAGGFGARGGIYELQRELSSMMPVATK